ncbi:MAG: heat shock protein HspQ [Gammaproteobacteria bacterium]|nr:heat shock protein HspQ [Gammaproteobacteria bacterium]MCB1922658.1 heat shock protein HspQ [Gammaproteobacteria bacterium]
MTAIPKFFVGQIVHHTRFDYRGVVIDVDPSYQGSEAWYQQVARTRPPKDQPWYRVLVDGGEHETYVAERHLEPDVEARPVSHPAISTQFLGYDAGVYRQRTH